MIMIMIMMMLQTWPFSSARASFHLQLPLSSVLNSEVALLNVSPSKIMIIMMVHSWMSHTLSCAHSWSPPHTPCQPGQLVHWDLTGPCQQGRLVQRSKEEGEWRQDGNKNRWEPCLCTEVLESLRNHWEVKESLICEEHKNQQGPNGMGRESQFLNQPHHNQSQVTCLTSIWRGSTHARKSKWKDSIWPS